MDDLFEPLTGPNAGAAPPRKHRHRWVRHETHVNVAGEAAAPVISTVCVSCGAIWDEATSRRGRNNRLRGNDIERDVAKRLGMQRVGQYGGPDDARDEMFVGQIKSGGSFPERMWRWLRAVPVNAGQTAILVVTDAPGPGHKRRGVVVVDLEDWVALHGPVTP